jgi:hypothetical protein
VRDEKFGRELAKKFAERLEISGRTGFCPVALNGSQSDGVYYQDETGKFVYAGYVEGNPIDVLKEFPNQPSFEAWFAEQSESSLSQIYNPSQVTRERVANFVRPLAEKHFEAFEVSAEPYGLELAKAVAANLKIENYPSAKSRFPARSGLAYFADSGTFAFCQIEMGEAKDQAIAFKTESEFAAWLAHQSDRTLDELSLEKWNEPSMVRGLGLSEFATTALNLRKPNL